MQPEQAGADEGRGGRIRRARARPTPRWLDDADLVIAADGGAGSLDRLGRVPDRLVGDLDSIDPRSSSGWQPPGTSIDRHPTDKEASDTELAVEAALEAGADRASCCSARSAELGSTTSSPTCSCSPTRRWPVATCSAVRGGTQVRALHGGDRLVLDGSSGDLVTLLPIGGDAAGVTTEGLRWQLDGATLRIGRSRGLSNEVVEPLRHRFGSRTARSSSSRQHPRGEIS